MHGPLPKTYLRPVPDNGDVPSRRFASKDQIILLRNCSSRPLLIGVLGYSIHSIEVQTSLSYVWSTNQWIAFVLRWCCCMQTVDNEFAKVVEGWRCIHLSRQASPVHAGWASAFYRNWSGQGETSRNSGFRSGESIHFSTSRISGSCGCRIHVPEGLFYAP